MIHKKPRVIPINLFKVVWFYVTNCIYLIVHYNIVTQVIVTESTAVQTMNKVGVFSAQVINVIYIIIIIIMISTIIVIIILPCVVHCSHWK